MYYIVYVQFFAIFGVYPMVILWVCYGYPMAGSAHYQHNKYLSRRRPLFPFLREDAPGYRMGESAQYPLKRSIGNA